MRFPRVALMQPTFLPWQGYFALIAEADLFVFLDDFQFCRRSFHHRNRLVIGGCPAWLTLPVAHSGPGERPSLCDVRPRPDARFRRRFLGTLRHTYGSALHFDAVYPAIEAWIGRDWPDLAALNIAFIELSCGWLGLTTRFRRSSELEARGTRSGRIADLLERTGASTYLAAQGSLTYMREDEIFPLRGIDTFFQEFEPQPHATDAPGGFAPYLSVLDALFWIGPDATRRLIEAGQRGFSPWCRTQPSVALLGA